MTKVSLSVLAVLSYGVLQSLAVTHSIRLDFEAGKNPNGCVNITACTYGCGQFSTNTVKNVLTPICGSKPLPRSAPERLTIRGEPHNLYLHDEDRDQDYNCRKVPAARRQYVCSYDTNPSSSIRHSYDTNSSSSINHSSDIYTIETAPNTPPSSTVFSQSASASHSATPSNCVFHPQIDGKGRGQGNLNDCCVNNNDCHGSCIRGACDAEKNIPTEIASSTNSAFTPTPSLYTCVYNPKAFGLGNGQGALNDCCQTNDDCLGSCIRGTCNFEYAAPPICTDITHQGKRKGKGPKGVCCDTQADCKEGCEAGICQGT